MGSAGFILGGGGWWWVVVGVFWVALGSGRFILVDGG